MMSPQPGIIWLVGVAGCGKSTVGPRLAVRLHRPFVDLDHRIQEAAGEDIAAVFASEGEAGFRLREEQALRDVGHAPPPFPVVACGAGVVELPGHHKLMAAPGMVLWLDVPVAEALARCRRQPGERPLMVDEAVYRRRLESRIPLYRALGRRVDADAPVDEIVDRAMAVLGTTAT
jgi:shikimate kinase